MDEHVKTVAKAAKESKSVKAHGKASLLSLTGQPKGDVQLPEVFKTEYRPDVILRAVVAEQSWARQPYGSDPEAGFRTTADYFGRRREYYRMTINRGMSRLPREKLAKGGLGKVRRVPHSRGGHRAHPPKAEAILTKKMNGKEWKLALDSAIAATVNPDLVTGDGRRHLIEKATLPLIIDSSFESLKRTKEVEDVFEKLGLSDDIERASEKKMKEGRSRTQKSKLGKSVLVVISGECDAAKAAENLAGVDVVTVDKLEVGQLAPGGHAGRLTLWTEKAIKNLK